MIDDAIDLPTRVDEPFHIALLIVEEAEEAAFLTSTGSRTRYDLGNLWHGQWSAADGMGEFVVDSGALVGLFGEKRQDQILEF
ncbi:MAG: hypothetical protein IIC90_10215 [Chloroflexi bacterium]|nr:hypothetical protein [Chloroflexota bacterium]